MKAPLIFVVLTLFVGLAKLGEPNELKEHIDRRKREIEVPSLSSLVSSVSSLSRVVSSISLQSNLSKIPIGDFLNLQHPEALEKLKDFEFPQNLEVKNLNETISMTRGNGESFKGNETENFKQRMDFLTDQQKMDALNKTIFLDLDDFISGMMNTTRHRVNLTAIKYYEIAGFGIFFEKSRYNMSSSLFALKLTLNSFCRDWHPNYKTHVIDAKNHRASPSSFLNMLGEFRIKYSSYVEDVKSAVNIADEFFDVNIKNLIPNLKGLEKEAEIFQKIQSNNSTINEVVSNLQEIFSTVQELKAHRAQRHRFSPDSKDVHMVFNTDLRSLKLQKALGVDQKDMRAIERHLQKLKKFHVAIRRLETTHRYFQQENSNLTSIFEIKRIGELLENALTLSNSLNFTTEQIQFLNKSQKCLELMNNTRHSIDVMELDEKLDLIHSVFLNVTSGVKLFDEVIQDPSFNNFQMLQKIRDLIPESAEFNISDADAVNVWNIIMNVSQISEFALNFSIAYKRWRDFEDLVRLERKNTTVQDYEFLKETQKVLNRTGIFETLNCLKAEGYVDKVKGVFKLVEAGKQMKTLHRYPNKLEVITNAIENILEVKNKVEKVKETITAGRRKRDALELPPDARKAADSLADGVHLLEDLLEVADSRFSELPNQIDNQLSALISSDPQLTTIWTPNLRDQFKSLSVEIKNLEKTAEKLMENPENLTQLFEIFTVSKSIKGVDFDAKLFGNPIATMLRNNGSLEKSRFFNDLKDLKLNYAAHSAQFKSAAESLDPIQKYFEKVFGIRKVIINETINEVKNETINEKIINEVKNETISEKIINEVKNETISEKIINEVKNETTGKGGEQQLEQVAQLIQKEHAEEEASQMYFIIALVVVVLLVLIAFLIYFFVIRKQKQTGAPKGEEHMWRHLRFLKEGQLIPKDDTEYTPLHLAVLNKNVQEVKTRIKEGADVNVHCVGKLNETPLHTAVNLECPEIVEILLKNGADANALDQNYESAKMKANGRPMIRKVFKDNEKKSFKKVPPKEFPSESYRIYLDEDLRGSAEIGSNMQRQIVEKVEQATHLIVRTEKDGVLDLDFIREKQGDFRMMAVLKLIFSPKILMTCQWLEASKLRSTEFQNDAKFRVKEVKFRGEIYRTIDEIQEEFQKMKIPYLTNTIVHFNQAKLHTLDWNDLRTVAAALGAEVVKDFPSGSAPKCPYYRDDLGHVFIVFLKKDETEIQESHAMLRSDKSYNFMERDEFISLLLSHKIHHKKLPESRMSSSEPSREPDTGATKIIGSAEKGADVNGVSGSVESPGTSGVGGAGGEAVSKNSKEPTESK